MINSIQISNFRSYKNAKVHLGNHINVFVGKNGQGKTNLLEAIYFVSNIRSHRTKNDIDLINRNEEYSRIVVIDDYNDKITAVIHNKGKYFSVNDITISKTSEVLGKINTVLFYPTETRLFSDSPAVRRTFFDVEIGKVSSDYTSNFQQFNKHLKDRNKVLKSKTVDPILLEIITNEMSKFQIEIIKERKLLTKFINATIYKYISKLINKDLNIRMEYKCSLEDLSYDEIIDKYKKSEKRDIFNKVTGEGIHRDDYVIYSNDIEIDKYLSQGQIRVVLLAIKFVLVEYIYRITKSTPILLLDDVLSELDLENQINLINTIPKSVQTIITTTDNHEIFKDDCIKKFKIKNSEIITEEE